MEECPIEPSGINHYQYCIGEMEPVPLNRLLVRDFGYSSRLLRRIKRLGGVTINGKDCWLCDTVTTGDRIEVMMPEESVDVLPVLGALDIIYEDDEVLAVNKDAGCVTHPTKRHQEDTLGNFVAHYFKSTGQNAKVRFINRLDMDTSGIVLIAKNNYVHHFVQSEKMCQKATKIYMAFVHGRLKEKCGTITFPIGRISEESIKRQVLETGKPCITHYEVIEEYNEASLLRLQLETGRTHQIRVHLTHVGHPIIGDSMYRVEGLPTYGMERQALHSTEMCVTLPKAGVVHLRAGFKNDMQELWEKIREN